MNRMIRIFIILILCIKLSFVLSSSKKLPQAIIIGAKKCGTRALLKFISAHPNVSAAGAEVHFFDKYYHKGLNWYKSQMPLSNENQITIEKTPKYLIDARAPERVFKMNANMKLIVVLRNPVVRAVSEYVQSEWRKKRSLNYLNNTMKFEKMIYEPKTKSKQATIRQDWSIVKNGIYVKHIKNWLKYFPIENFLFINGENLIQKPHEEIEKLQTFLNLKQLIKKEHFVMTSQKKGFMCIVKPLDSNQVKCLSDQKGRKHPVISKRVLQHLSQFYRPFNKELFDLIKQEFWKY